MVSIIPPGLVKVCPQTWKRLVFKVGTMVGNIKSCKNSIITGKVYFICIGTNLLNDFKGTIRSRHQLGLVLGRKSLLPQVNPYQVSRLKMNLSLVLVGIVHRSFISFGNAITDLGMEFLNFFCPFLGFPTKLSGSWNRNEIKRAL